MGSGYVHVCVYQEEHVCIKIDVHRWVLDVVCGHMCVYIEYC